MNVWKVSNYAIFCVLFFELNGTDWAILHVFDRKYLSEVVTCETKITGVWLRCEVGLSEIWLYRNGSIMEHI